MRFRRSCELKESQLEQALNRIKKQENQISELEEELLYVNNTIMNISSSFGQIEMNKKDTLIGTKTIATDPCFIVKTLSKEIQTLPGVITIENNENDIICSLKEDIKRHEKQIVLKDTNIQEQSKIIKELEKNIDTLKLQLVEKEHEMLQSANEPNRQQINIIDEVDLEEHNKLKVS